MTSTVALALFVILFVLILSIIFFVFRRITRNNVNVEESGSLWLDRNYHCPHCKQPMEQGYVLAGKGIIWSPRRGNKIGTFAHIGQALDNTMSLRIPPALNMAWQCAQCKLTIVDHSQLVKTK